MKNTGFTLIELILTLTIIAIISATVYPSFSKIQTKAKESAVKNIVRSIQIAVESYNLSFDMYPIGTDLSGHDLFTLLQQNGDFLSIPTNPFSGSSFSSTDTSGKIFYSYDLSKNSYFIVGYGLNNNKVIVSVKNS